VEKPPSPAGGTDPEPEDVKLFISVFGVYRDYVKQEDNLINNRLTWLLIINGFLYTFYGTMINNIINTIRSDPLSINKAAVNSQSNAAFVAERLCHSRPLAGLVLLAISIVGLLISVAAYFSISAAQKALDALQKSFSLNAGRLFQFYHPFNVGFQFYHWFNLGCGAKYEFCKTSTGYIFPGLSAGGVRYGLWRGVIAPRAIPCVLAASWIVSLIFLWFSYSKSPNAFCS